MLSPSSSLRRARALLGTMVEIKATGADQVLSAAVDAAFAEIERVQRLMSFHDPGSDVSLLNRFAYKRVVKVDPMTWAVLARAHEIAKVSGGAFDVTVAPQLVKWGLLPAADGAADLEVKQDGYRRIELLEDCVRFREPAQLDLGGIAKGYAVDRAARALEEHGIRDYVVNAGGDLRVGATAEAIHVRHPACPQRLIPVGMLRAAAIATSADYFTRKKVGGRRVHAIVAPSDGRPATPHASVSVVAAECMTADALTKVTALRGERAVSVLARFDAEGILIDYRGVRRLNSSLRSTASSSGVDAERALP